MEKFLHLTYDFFAFALPGILGIIVLVYFFHTPAMSCHACADCGGENIFLFTWEHFCKSLSGWALLCLTVGGYLFGYLITPVAFTLLFNRFGLYLPCLLDQSVKRRTARIIRRLSHGQSIQMRTYVRFRTTRSMARMMSRFVRIQHSRRFIPVREKATVSARYIEFWDMHAQMANNLAFVTFLYLGLRCLKLIAQAGVGLDFTSYIVFELMAAFIAAFTFLCISTRYRIFWIQDLRAAYRYIQRI